jgi:holo-[acyl-carrier protein] synthase
VEIVSVGVDVCDIARMETALARHPTMRSRVFTAEEVAYCDSKARPAESFAGRFAVREAVIKALGGYFGKRWQDISVSRARSGEPAIVLSGNARARAAMLGIDRFIVSFAHERSVAVAFVVGVSA